MHAIWQCITIQYEDVVLMLEHFEAQEVGRVGCGGVIRRVTSHTHDRLQLMREQHAQILWIRQFVARTRDRSLQRITIHSASRRVDGERHHVVTVGITAFQWVFREVRQPHRSREVPGIRSRGQCIEHQELSDPRGGVVGLQSRVDARAISCRDEDRSERCVAGLLEGMKRQVLQVDGFAESDRQRRRRGCQDIIRGRRRSEHSRRGDIDIEPQIQHIPTRVDAGFSAV